MSGCNDFKKHRPPGPHERVKNKNKSDDIGLIALDFEMLLMIQIIIINII